MDVTVVEVGPRDGLQNESAVLPTGAKVELIHRLVGAGARRIEAVSFVNPKLVPQMADAEAVMEQVDRSDDVSYIGLVLNRRGLDRAMSTGVDEVNVVVGVSDTFSRRNQNASTDEAMDAAVEIISGAGAAGLATTLTLSTAFGCPFEGAVDPDRVVALAVAGAEAGVDEICLGDTIGVGTPDQVRNFTARIRTDVPGSPALRYHFHNTRNTGFANAYAAVLDGVTVLDASAGGIGGCPFAPKATGNIATDDLVYLLHRMGLTTGIDLARLMPISGFLSGQLGHEVPAMLPKAGDFPG
jgi:isopropylmalate/homocitrate/citramalate synthase